MAKIRIGFSTYNEAPALTQDDLLVANELKLEDIEAVPVPWDRFNLENHNLDGIVIRSSWNYHLKTEEFKNWLGNLEARGIPVWNPPLLLRWNLHKSYLSELQSRGVLIPSTTWLKKGTTISLDEIFDQSLTRELVLKPAVSLSAYKTWRVNHQNRLSIEPDFQKSLETEDFLVQEFIPEILEGGEISLMFFGKSFSHAVRKRARPGDFRVQNDFGGSREVMTIDLGLLAEAQNIIEKLDDPLLYARVDGVQTKQGFVLMELELIDPVLFFEYDVQASKRFVARLKEILT